MIMRDIKFRVYDTKLFVMYTPEMDKEEKNLWRMSANGGDFTHSYSDGILMQYTGLKDKTGKEIYEGDIIISDCKLIYGEVKFLNSSFVTEWCADVYSDLLGWSNWNRGTARDSLDIEIIGNIHENPELL